MLFPLHYQRLLHGMKLLNMEPAWSSDEIAQWIQILSEKNGCTEMARIRWAVYRHDDGAAGFVLEAGPLGPEAFCWQEQGWHLSIYSENQKAPGPLANLKTANYLLYLLAAAAAKKGGVDECLVLNAHGQLCDGSRTNIFLVKNGLLQTPALACGPVAGVMRKHLLQHCNAANIPVEACALTPADMLEADEIFLTNAVQGIRWVSRFGDKKYDAAFSKRLYESALAGTYRGI